MSPWLANLGAKSITPSTAIVPPTAAEGVKIWHCEPCGFLYNESEGLPEKGAPAGTRFEDLPIGWHGPDCDAGKLPFLEVSF